MTQSIPQTLPELPPIPAGKQIPYESIRYIAGYATNFVHEYATEYAKLCLAARAMGVAGIPEGYAQSVIDELYENGDPVSVDAAELLTKMLSASPPPAPQREPLTTARICALSRDAQIAYCLDKFSTFDEALTRAVEAAHGIKEGS